MSLDALAPDQRAVVQLVLQQDRSYEDLAGLLGITPAAVRERAHRGLERLAPGEALSATERERIGDYLLGQQSVSERESTRSLLTGSQPARSWAHAVSTELASVARSPLPEIPAGTDAPAASVREPEATEPVVAGDDDPLLSDPVTPATRARPRPRQRETAPADFGFSEVAAHAKDKDEAKAKDADTGTDADDRQAPSTNRLGGALLIAGLAILVAALVIFLVNRGDDDTDPSASSTSAAEASATASASGSPAASDLTATAFLELQAVEGKGRGILVLFTSPDGEFAINVEAERLEPNGAGEAYGLWLTGGSENHFLGYTSANEDGTLQASGPQPQDAAEFGDWLLDSKKVVLSIETADAGTEPTRVIMDGVLKRMQRIEAPTATPTP